MGKRFFGRLLAIGTMALATPALAQNLGFESQFDTVLGTEVRTPQSYDAVYSTPLERQIAQLADGSNGRIGVYAIDLATGREIGVLADQRFPMASTSKVAIAATFLEGVDQGKWSLTSEFPLLIPVSSAPFSSPVAPVRPGAYMTAGRLMELMLTRSNNYAIKRMLYNFHTSLTNATNT